MMQNGGNAVAFGAATSVHAAAQQGKRAHEEPMPVLRGSWSLRRRSPARTCAWPASPSRWALSRWRVEVLAVEVGGVERLAVEAVHGSAPDIAGKGSTWITCARAISAARRGRGRSRTRSWRGSGGSSTRGAARARRRPPPGGASIARPASPRSPSPRCRRPACSPSPALERPLPLYVRGPRNQDRPLTQPPRPLPILERQGRGPFMPSARRIVPAGAFGPGRP
jgi:hypothetical protein